MIVLIFLSAISIKQVFEVLFSFRYLTIFVCMKYWGNFIFGSELFVPDEKTWKAQNIEG